MLTIPYKKKSTKFLHLMNKIKHCHLVMNTLFQILHDMYRKLVSALLLNGLPFLYACV